MQVLLVKPDESIGPLPVETADLFAEMGWSVTAVDSYRDALGVAQGGSVNAVVLAEPPVNDREHGERDDYEHLLRLIDTQRMAAVLVTENPRHESQRKDSLVDPVSPGIGAAELRGRLAVIDRYQTLLVHMERELSNMERLGKRLNQHFREVDQEMRLAARLQRDFLPNLQKPIHNVQFAAVYRPASWVSGDMFDVFRIDEHHTGFWVADAVGHGMAASLLTMFIKRAIVPKRIEGDRYTILNPAETMAALNDALASQGLPNCQFVTACYCVLDHRSMKLTYARGGHPYPVLLGRDGMLSELKCAGGLLGLFPDEEFPASETQLRPGDKILLFTDGVEMVFQSGGVDPLDKSAYYDTFTRLAHQPIQPMLSQIEAQLDDEVGSLNPNDDITIVGLEVLDS